MPWRQGVVTAECAFLTATYSNVSAGIPRHLASLGAVLARRGPAWQSDLGGIMAIPSGKPALLPPAAVAATAWVTVAAGQLALARESTGDVQAAAFLSFLIAMNKAEAACSPASETREQR
jgi:hypothetical protein